MTVKELKKGDFFTKKELSAPNDTQVWIRGEYDRASKRYVITRFSDFCDTQLMRGDKEVFTDFTF